MVGRKNLRFGLEKGSHSWFPFLEFRQFWFVCFFQSLFAGRPLGRFALQCFGNGRCSGCCSLGIGKRENNRFMIKISTTIGSIVTIGFGVWHFFVPTMWHWYAYIDPAATELILAVRAVNLLFSLSLVLFGAANLLVVFKAPEEKCSLMVLLSASSILWASRSILQILYPQVSYRPGVQYCLLLTFILVFACFAISLWVTWSKNKFKA